MDYPGKRVKDIAERYAFGYVFYLSALRPRIQAGWARIQAPGFSESLFFRYVNSMNIEPLFRNLLFAAWVFALSMVFSIPGALAGDLSPESPHTQTRVVASILPIHSLVAGVMQGVGTPSLIVQGYGSPHTYRMRPSGAATLHNADLVFWVGETLETFLRSPLSALPKTVRIVALLETPGLTLYKNRQGGLWDTHDDIHTHAHVHDSAATEPAHFFDYNPHIWLDPENAGRLVRAIARHLRKIDPAHGDRYDANASALSKRILALERRLAGRFEALGDAPYLVFHDAYLYLERRYGLRAVGSVTANPNRIPGARRITELRAAIRHLGIRCIFREPQFNTKFIDTALEGADIHIGILDPIGVAIPPGPDHWFRMMEAHGDVLSNCLRPIHGEITQKRLP